MLLFELVCLVMTVLFYVAEFPVGGTIFLVFTIWGGLLIYHTKVQERQKEKLEKFENEQRKIKSEKERKEKIVSFFEECQQRKIDETDEASIRIIAQKYGFLDSSKIMEFYSEAKQLFEEKKNEEEAKQKRRDREVQRINNSKRSTSSGFSGFLFVSGEISTG